MSGGRRSVAAIPILLAVSLLLAAVGTCAGEPTQSTAVDNPGDVGYWTSIAISIDEPHTSQCSMAGQDLLLTLLGQGPPSPPRNLTSSHGDGYILLEWLVPEDMGGSYVYIYEVYRGLAPDEMATMGTVGNLTSYNDNSVENGVTYYYKVRARNDQGWSEFSSVTSATPYGTPGAPTGLEAETLEGQVELDWNAPADDGGKPVENYRVYRGPSSSQLSLLTIIGNVTQYTDGNVSDGNTYVYRVSAINEEGEGQYSSTAQVTLGGGGGDLTLLITLVAAAAIAVVVVAFLVMRRRS